MKRPPCLLQMTKGKVGSLLVFDPEKISFEDQSAIKSATSDAVVGIVTERGGSVHACPYTSTAVKTPLARRELGACGRVGKAHLWVALSTASCPMLLSYQVICALLPAEVST